MSETFKYVHAQQQSGFSLRSLASCFSILRASAEGFGGGGFKPKQHSYTNVYNHPNIYYRAGKKNAAHDRPATPGGRRPRGGRPAAKM